MKFMVTRASVDRHCQPCAGAIKEEFVRIERRTVDDPAKLNRARDREEWFERGRNHRVIKGEIARDFDDEAWFVELADLDALIAFNDKYGVIDLGWCWDNDSIREITIADGEY